MKPETPSPAPAARAAPTELARLLEAFEEAARADHGNGIAATERDSLEAGFASLARERDEARRLAAQFRDEAAASLEECLTAQANVQRSIEIAEAHESESAKLLEERDRAEAALKVLAANPHALCDEHAQKLTALARDANLRAERLRDAAEALVTSYDRSGRAGIPPVRFETLRAALRAETKENDHE